MKRGGHGEALSDGAANRIAGKREYEMGGAPPRGI